MKKIIILFVVYTLSCYGAFKFVQNTHYHPQGRWNTMEPELSDVLYVVTPVVNSYYSVIYLSGGWKYKERQIKPRKETKIFRPKKPLV